MCQNLRGDFYKKYIVFLTVLFLFISGNMVCVNAGADIAVGITINGEIIETDVSPFVENGRTLVPLRAVSEHLKYSVEWFAEEMGCEVNWDEENNIASVIKYNIAEANTPHYIILNTASYTKIILKEQEYDLSELDAINIDNPMFLQTILLKDTNI